MVCTELLAVSAQVPEWSKGPDSSSGVFALVGSNPTLRTAAFVSLGTNSWADVVASAAESCSWSHAMAGAGDCFGGACFVLFCFYCISLQLSVCLWWHDYRRECLPTLKFVVVIAFLLAIC